MNCLTALRDDAGKDRHQNDHAVGHDADPTGMLGIRYGTRHGDPEETDHQGVEHFGMPCETCGDKGPQESEGYAQTDGRSSQQR